MLFISKQFVHAIFVRENIETGVDAPATPIAILFLNNLTSFVWKEPIVCAVVETLFVFQNKNLFCVKCFQLLEQFLLSFNIVKQRS